MDAAAQPPPPSGSALPRGGALHAHAAAFSGALQAQLSNQFVGGSLALAAASMLLRLLWAALRWAGATAADALSTRFDFPLGSPQCIAAARWLQAQPRVRRDSRRVVMDARAARLAATGATGARALACRACLAHLRARFAAIHGACVRRRAHD
jgi:hypothetical protein